MRLSLNWAPCRARYEPPVTWLMKIDTGLLYTSRHSLIVLYRLLFMKFVLC